MSRKINLEADARAGLPLVMGILNVTPDSFSDGGQHDTRELALRHAHSMAAEGADIIDVGGESTRPGAAAVSVDEELSRVIPVIEAIRAELELPISLDTSTPEVMVAGAAAGADMLNDVRALQRPGALEAAAGLGLPVCLMHMQGQPGNMQSDPHYSDVVAEVGDFLLERAAAACNAGIPQQSLILDPGFGFGKTLEHNLLLLAAMPKLRSRGYPLLAGLSRKSMLGQLLGRELSERLPGSVALAMLAAQGGADILRVHDVAPTVDALRVLAAVNAAQSSDFHG